MVRCKATRTSRLVVLAAQLAQMLLTGAQFLTQLLMLGEREGRFNQNFSLFGVF